MSAMPGDREPKGQSGGPAPNLTLREGRDDRRERDPQQRRPDEVDLDSRSPVGRLPDEHDDEDGQEEDERDRRMVGVPPPVVLRDERSEWQADGEPDPEHRAQQALRPRHQLSRELLPHEGHPERQDGEADTLDGPGRDHEREVRGEPGHGDGGRVGEHRPDEHLPLAVDVAEFADHRRERDSRDRIGRDDEAHLSLVDVEVRLDRGERGGQHPLDVEYRS